MEQQNISIIEGIGNIRRIGFNKHNNLAEGVAMDEFDLLKKIIDISRDGIAIFNKSHNLVYINLAFVIMSGYNVMELKGLSVKEFSDKLLPQQSIRVPFDVYALGNEDSFPDFKYILKKKNAGTAFVQISICRISEMQDKTNPGCAMIVREINSLIESQKWRAKANLLMQNTKVGVLAINKEQIITLFNKPAEDIMGLNSSDIIGKSYNDAFPDVAQEEKYLLHALLYGLELNGKEVHHSPMHREGVFVLTTAQLKDEYNDVIGAMAIFEDLTEQRKYEQEVAKAERMAIVSEVAAGMAHEVRNPLTAVKGFLQLLNKQLHDKKDLEEYVQVALSELDRANEIISEFLSLTKPQSTDMVDASINHMLYQIITLVESQANMQGITIITKLDQQLPKIRMDSGKIKQVFLNLIQNAVQAMPSGGNLNVITSCDTNAKKIIAEITDTGQGIPEGHISKIFSPFFSTKESGTGLGLTVSYRIIQNHGGTIEVKSQMGVGTTFIVRLPMQ